MGNRTFIGIGSNMGDRQRNYAIAIQHIRNDHRVLSLTSSALYNTSPVSDVGQDDFINGAVLIDWEGSALELLDFLQGIENKMGRERGIVWGPRAIDLDILLFSDFIMETATLTIPHPRLHERKFAILPCLDMDPHIIHPLFERPLRDFLPLIGNEQKIERVDIS